MYAPVQLVLLLNVVAILDIVLSQVADGVDSQVDPSGQSSDRLKHLFADVLDHHVAEEDVDAGPEDDDWQPDLKHSVKEQVFKLIGAFFDSFLVKEEVILILSVCHFLFRSKFSQVRVEVKDEILISQYAI